MCHVSEISETADKHSIPLEIGTECEFKIIRLNPSERKIGLSIKALQAPAERNEAEKFQPQSTSTATNTIGDMMAMKERNSAKR